MKLNCTLYLLQSDIHWIKWIEYKSIYIYIYISIYVYAVKMSVCRWEHTLHLNCTMIKIKKMSFIKALLNSDH